MDHSTRLGLVSLNHGPSTAIRGIKDETRLEGRTSPNPSPRKITRYKSPVQDIHLAHSPLDKMFDLPLELLVEIATYLRPLDIIRLARVNKISRGLFLRRSAACVWRAALRIANALPPVSTDLPDHLLAALLFLAECTICGKYTDENADFFLRVKLCAECRGTDLIPATGISFAKLLFVSPSKGTSLRSSNVCLREDYKKIKSKHEALQTTRDAQALKSWTKEQLKIVEDRSKSARLLSKWFKTWTKSRQVNQRLSRKERRQLTNARVTDIEVGMAKMGYQRSEVRHLRVLEPQKWREWVANSGPLDEQAWELLTPHLLHHLEKHRKRLRCSARQPTLDGILLRIQNRLKPISCIQPQLDIESWTLLSAPNDGSPAPEPIDSCASSPDNDIFLPSFPHNTDILLICAGVQAAMEAQTPRETFELEIQTKDSDIEHAAQAWRDVLELALLNLLPTDTRPAEVETSEYKLVLGNSRDTRPLDLLSVECRKLLRADSIFCLRTPLLSFKSRGLLYYPEDFQSQFKISDRTNLQCHDVAARIAKALLCAIELPDASYIAMNTVTRLYQCGRCDDKPVFYLWKELLQHYMEKSRANQMTTNTLGSSDPGSSEAINLDISMHDVDSVCDKPLVQLVDPAVYIPALATLSNQDHFVCLLCLHVNDPADTYVGGDNIRYYFQNVHLIDEPIEGVHYIQATPELLHILYP
ncbi:unnamed protein product [Rhizoctonia solani]|uniref:F-box domain-containing protein n=1 Tax=Rhizoctonia solani TaxID=456999 RepID=A0A8H3AFN4_9AGAM|nr:unnamed protein product [Rhizoctonia solani]